MSVKDIIISFLQGKNGAVATLQEINDVVLQHYQFKTRTPLNSIRRTLYQNQNTFVRVCKAVYMLKGEKTASLLIEGNGRTLSEIEDGTIDCIITDHPWQDKKAHKGGNRDLASYDVFRYEKSDFEAKARVLKDGSYLAEILPVESATNYEYLYEIKKMAESCGLNYYTSLLWKAAPTNSVNTGRVTKGVQQILIFSKGKPRKLSPQNVQGYQTKKMLQYELEYFVERKAKNRHHQAEKPVELYEYLIQMLTEEKEVCLDQFGGSCNMIQAAINTNRFSIVYELCSDFVKNAVNRFGCDVLVCD